MYIHIYMDIVPQKIRAAIVDDEPLARIRVRELLTTEHDIEVVGEYRDARTASAGIRSTPPDLLFLDVQMPRGSAFTILESLAPEVLPATIFITAHDSYALRAFDFRAIDYLLKPFDSERFRRSVDRARRHLTIPSSRGTGKPARPAEAPSRLAVRRGGKVYFVKLDEIDWLETAGNYVRLHVRGDSYLYRDSLVNFETRLNGQRFVKVHRSMIVNLDRITQLEPSFRGEHVITLADGTRLTLAHSYRGRLENLVGRF